MSDTIENDADDMATESNGGEHVYKYGDEIAINFADVPPAMLRLGFSRAAGHVLSNEVLSRVGGMIAKAVASGELPSDDYKGNPTVAAWRDAKALELRLAWVESVRKGLWGAGTRGPSGPRVDSLTVEYDRAIADAVRTYLKGLVTRGAIAYDKEGKQWYWMDANGSRQTRTFDEAVENYTNGLSNEEKYNFTETARDAVAAKERRAAATKAAVAGATETMRL